MNSPATSLSGSGVDLAQSFRHRKRLNAWGGEADMIIAMLRVLIATALTMVSQNVASSSAIGMERIAISQQRQESFPDICGWIGVQVSPITRPFAESLGMTELYGAIFDPPEPNSPAAQAHIEAGDVLTAINGVPLSSWSDFTSTISAVAPGAEVYLTTYAMAN